MRNFSFILFSVVFMAGDVFAASCVPTSASEQLARADVVFEGTVIARVRDEAEKNSLCTSCNEQPECNGKVATFNVGSVLKGSASNGVTVYSGDSCAGLGSSFTLDKSYRVYANKSDSELPLKADYQGGYACGGTLLLND